MEVSTGVVVTVTNSTDPNSDYFIGAKLAGMYA